MPPPHGDLYPAGVVQEDVQARHSRTVSHMVIIKIYIIRVLALIMHPCEPVKEVPG